MVRLLRRQATKQERLCYGSALPCNALSGRCWDSKGATVLGMSGERALPRLAQGLLPRAVVPAPGPSLRPSTWRNGRRSSRGPPVSAPTRAGWRADAATGSSRTSAAGRACASDPPPNQRTPLLSSCWSRKVPDDQDATDVHGACRRRPSGRPRARASSASAPARNARSSNKPSPSSRKRREAVPLDRGSPAGAPAPPPRARGRAPRRA
jgi:hypothetical protein